MVDRIRYPTVSYLPFYYIFFDFQFLLLTIFNLQAKIFAKRTYSQTWAEAIPMNISLVLLGEKALNCDEWHITAGRYGS